MRDALKASYYFAAKSLARGTINPYLDLMTWGSLLLVIGMVSTLSVLAVGLIGFMRRGGGAQAAMRSNRFMQMRVVLQAITLGVLALAMYLKSRH